MEALARRILKKPIEVLVGSRSVVCKEVEQHVAVIEEDAKFFKLLELLGHYWVIERLDASQPSPSNLCLSARRKREAFSCSWTSRRTRTFY